MIDLLQFPKVLRIVKELVTRYMGKELLVFINNDNGNKEELEIHRADIYIKENNLIIEDLCNYEISYCIDIQDVIDCNVKIEEYDIDSFIEMSWGLIHINSFA